MALAPSSGMWRLSIANGHGGVCGVACRRGSAKMTRFAAEMAASRSLGEMAAYGGDVLNFQLSVCMTNAVSMSCRHQP